MYSENSYVEILTPSVMVVGGRTFGRRLGHESGALMHGIRALIRGTPESSHALFLPCEVTTRSWQSVTQKTALTRTQS